MRSFFCSSITALLVTGWLTGCGGKNAENRFIIPAQSWQDIEIRVETRPEPVRVGMNEFIIIINDHLKKIRPAYDYIVDIRTSNRYPWRQAIQDGHSGVYRRAVPLDQIKHPVLQVRIEKEIQGGGRTTLFFPLNAAMVEQVMH